MSKMNLEEMAAELEKSGQYKVLRKLDPSLKLESVEGVEVRTGLFVDVETTGLDAFKDEIIELAMVPFDYALDGRIVKVHPAVEMFNEPRGPIPPKISALTGITDEMVKGHKIDTAKVAEVVARASLVISHNAQFDRGFLERSFDVFVKKPWACSMTQIDWDGEGFQGRKLGYLLMDAGYFHDGHRAANDCLAALHLLSGTLPRSGSRALFQLLEKARSSTWRIFAEGAPFEAKDVLKARGYRWNARNRVWYFDVEDSLRDAEMGFLFSEVFGREVDLPVNRITALDRFSSRVD